MRVIVLDGLWSLSLVSHLVALARGRGLEAPAVLVAPRELEQLEQLELPAVLVAPPELERPPVPVELLRVEDIRIGRRRDLDQREAADLRAAMRNAAKASYRAKRGR